MTEVEQGNKSTKWIWIGLGGALLFCLCAAAIGTFTFFKVGQKVSESVNSDPEAASQAAHEIADYDLPAGYEERMSMDIMFYSFVMIGPSSYGSGEPLIMLAQFQAGADQEQMEQQLRQSMEQQQNTRGMEMQLVDVKKATIRGEETEISIYEGTDQTGRTMRQLITSFPGKDGIAMLMIMGSPEYWNDSEMDQFVESIH